MHKKIISLITILLLPLYASAQISQLVLPALKEEVNVQNVVFDCSSADKNYIASSLGLIDMSIKEYIANDIPYNIVLMIHSDCTDIIFKNVADNDQTMKDIHHKLQSISEHQNVSIETSQISIESSGINYHELLPFVTLVPNSIIRVISLQNDGYAFIPLSK
jgi:intracellular sulfur oxidation DsrE/DsrF family protein